AARVIQEYHILVFPEWI
ncbi:hypothetical protein VN97_g12173, partial [Penicillium thymicola]